MRRMTMRWAGGGRELREEEAEEAGVLARIVERQRGEGRVEEGTKDYTENISLLEKFSTPLSASIVIYARDEGGYGALYHRF